MNRIVTTRRSVLAGSAALAVSTAFPPGAVAQMPKAGGRLIVAADSEPKNLNPAIVASNGVFFVASKVIEPLAEASFDGKDGLSPRLATSWEGSEDGLSVTFKLRDGVNWHDGKPFTSADVAFSALKSGSRCRISAGVVFANLEAVDTPGRSHRHLPVLQADAVPADPQRAAGVTSVVAKHIYEAPTSPRTRPTHSSSAPVRSSSPNTSPANITG